MCCHGNYRVKILQLTLFDPPLTPKKSSRIIWTNEDNCIINKERMYYSVIDTQATSPHMIHISYVPKFHNYVWSNYLNTIGSMISKSHVRWPNEIPLSSTIHQSSVTFWPFDTNLILLLFALPLKFLFLLVLQVKAIKVHHAQARVECTPVCHLSPWPLYADLGFHYLHVWHQPTREIMFI